MATARSHSGGCTSSSASPAPSPTALSRSPSPTPAFRPTASLLDRSGGPAIPSTPFGPVKQINAGALNTGYAESGPAVLPLVSSPSAIGSPPDTRPSTAAANGGLTWPDAGGTET